MNSMHNSFSGPGGYSGAYPGYVPPPSALPYYNGYPGDINQSSNPYYGKPGTSMPPGYSSGMAAYTPPINNSSMYYQQYGLGYQYGYSKYSLGSSLGYSSEIPSGPSIHPPSIGTLQAPTTDLGLTGSMFSKNSKFSSGQGSSSSPHTGGLNLSHATNSTMLSPATPNTPSPGPHALSGNLRGAGATPSPPVEATEAKKDLEKMRRCQVCGQVFRLMSECLAHMKAVHEAPLNVYSLQHTAGGHVTQSLTSSSVLPPHSLASGLGPPTSRHGSMGTPDSPLMALERMGWGEKQNIMSTLQSSSPLTSSYTPAPTLPTNSQMSSNIPPHSHHQSSSGNPPNSAQVYQSHQHNIPGQHQSPLLHSPAQHHSPSSLHPSPVRHASPAPQLISVSQHSGMSSNQNSPAISDPSIPDPAFSQSSVMVSLSNQSTDTLQSSSNVEELPVSNVKHRKTNSYSVSSIIGETREKPIVKEERPICDDPPEQSVPEKVDLRVETKHEEENEAENQDNLPENKNVDKLPPDDCKQFEEFKGDNEDKCVASPMQQMSAVPTEPENEFIDKSKSLSAVERIEQTEELGKTPDAVESPNVSLLSSPHDGADQETLDLSKDSMKAEVANVIESPKNVDTNIEENDIKPDTFAYVEPHKNVKEEEAEEEEEQQQQQDIPESTMVTQKESEENVEVKENIKKVELVPEHQTGSPEDLTSQQETSQPESDLPQTQQVDQQDQIQHQQQLSQQQGQSQPQQSEGLQQQQQQQPPSQAPHQHQHPSPPIGMFHSQSSMKQQPQASFGGWPMSVGPGYSSQYPYPCSQGSPSQPNVSQQQLPPNALPGNNMCSKPHGYPVHSRFPSQYHQPGLPSGGPYPHDHHSRGPGPHNYIQNHPQNHTQGSWFPSNQRGDSKAMWGNWPNQSGQSYPQGFYAYPGGSQSQGQKLHHHQQPPPPAHVHPPQASHMHNMQHSHMSQQQPQVSKASVSQHYQQQLPPQQPPPQQPTPQQPPHQPPPHQQPPHQQPPHQQPPHQQPPHQQPPHQQPPPQQPPPHQAQQQGPQQSFSHQRQASNIPASPHDPQKDHCLTHPVHSPGRPLIPVTADKNIHQNSSLPSSDQQQIDKVASQPCPPTNKNSNQSHAMDSSSGDKPTENIASSEMQVPVPQTLPNSIKKFGHKIGPKSKTLAAKQFSNLEDLDDYKCTITVQENGTMNGYGSHGSASSNGGHQSCDSSDSEVAAEDIPIFTLLRPVKRKNRNVGKDGIFVGPKRIKLAKQVRERQERRQRNLQEQIRQSELEEQLLAQRAELATEHNGPLANILLQSSILLADNKVEESDSVEECIASIKAERDVSSSDNFDNDGDKSGFLSGNNGANSGNKKAGRKGQTKVFHNENSVIIKDIASSTSLRKLRAKDFKWSHYIKSMRYWCNDCAQGFKNQKEASSHSEDRCKWNCLYMLECYVVVKDIQTHPAYGAKVQELLEEYQVDGEHQCITCSEVIARKADYLVHVDSHKDFMPWECTICGTRFKIRGSLKEHLRYTHMKGRVPCLKCNKVFPTSTLLRQHVKVHTQHYKYKSAKNREEELRAAMEATAGALEGPPVGTTSPEDNEKLSHEANEYRNWCKLMEMNALKNLSTPGTMGGSSACGSIGDEEEEEGRGDGDASGSGEEGSGTGAGSIGENSCSEMPRSCLMRSGDSKADVNS